MPLELGERLVEVGLVTRSQLGRHGVVPHGAALVRKLVGAGLVDEALAGYFLSEGFGPLLTRSELESAEAALVARLPGEMAWEFLVLPLRETPSGVVVAMAAPSDRHVVRETTRLLGTNILPTACRYQDLVAELQKRHPMGAREERHDSEPPVLQLVRRREPKAATSLSAVEAPRRPSIVPASDDDEPVLLVRHKPIASKPAVVVMTEPAAPVATTSEPSSPKPTDTKVGAVVQKSFPAPVGRAESAAAFRSGRDRKATTSEYEVARKSQADAKAAEVKVAEAKAVEVKAADVKVAEAKAVEVKAADVKVAEVKAVEVKVADPKAPRMSEQPDPASVLPPPNDRWDLPAPEAKPDAKVSVSRNALPSGKAAAGDIAPTLASMRGARDRDAIVRLACEGAVTIARSAVFLALRKGVLKGWDGAGQGVSRDSVRNLWIPAGSESMFKRVIDSGAPFVGAYGQGIADGLFRAAVGSRGGDVAVWPVSLEGKIVGLLCVDDLRPGSISRHRIETLTVAIAEGFRRLINTGKNE